MSQTVVHLPGLKGSPACGARGAMSCTVDGLVRTPIGTALSGANHPDLTCERCKTGGPAINRRWRYWLSAYAAGRDVKARAGSFYRIAL